MFFSFYNAINKEKTMFYPVLKCARFSMAEGILLLVVVFLSILYVSSNSYSLIIVNIIPTFTLSISHIIFYLKIFLQYINFFIIHPHRSVII